MDRQLLVYFREVAKLEHVSRAAEKIHIAQPTLSLAIRRLEDEVGVPLFDRHGRSLRLNSYGRAFLAKVEPALDLLEEGLSELREMQSVKNNHLTITSPSLFAFEGLMPRILEYNPGITFSYSESNAVETINRLLNKQTDFCISSSPLSDTKLNSVILRLERMVAVISNKHRFAGQSSIKLSECADESFAAYSKDSLQRQVFEIQCKAAGFKPKVVFESYYLRDILQAIRASTNYLTLASEPGLDSYKMNDDLIVLPITDVDSSSVLRMYWPKSGVESQTSKTVRHIIIDYFKEVSKNEEKGCVQ